MIQTKVLTDGEPLENILRGAEKLYKAVSVTMGPRGQNVIFKKYGKQVGITHDGVTVANLVTITDSEAENIGAELLKEAAKKLDSTTGDGTTTVTVLTYHILKEAAAQVKQGTSPMKLKLELETLIPEIVAAIEKHTDHNVTEEKLIQVASVAAGSKEIGETVGKALYAAGKDTPIMLGFSDSPETWSEVINGYKIDSGPASPYLMNGAGVRLEIMNPRIAVVDAKLRDKDDIMPLLELMARMKDAERKVLLVCTDIAGDALAYMVANRLKGFADIAVARVPEHIGSPSEYLSDLAVSCGAQVLSRNTGNTIKAPQIEHLGTADKVTVEPRETVIVNGHPIEEDLGVRIAELKDFQKNGKTVAARKFAQDRLMALEQKIVGIFVGGQSESEAEERHYRFEDAVGACRASLRGGVVPGGGTLLADYGNWLITQEPVSSKIVGEALLAPIRKVLENAGIDNHDTFYKPGKGYDVMHPEDGVIDLVERGILDPAESEIECVKTAISIAGLLITSGAMIVDEGDKDEIDDQISTRQS